MTQTFEHLDSIYKTTGKNPSSFQEFMEAVVETINTLYPGYLLGVSIEVSYSSRVSNTHCCPINGTTNWGGQKKYSPRGYPGYTGRIWFRINPAVTLKQGTSDIFKRYARIHTGTGGAGGYHGPWDAVAHAFYTVRRSFSNYAFPKYSPHAYSYDMSMFLDDFPLLQQQIEKLDTYHLLKHSTHASISHSFSWVSDYSTQLDERFMNMATNYNHNPQLIGIVGLIGSGKSTMADFLTSTFKFSEASFASSVKSVVCAIFGYNASDIAGITKESRAWRETVDDWWSERLGIPGLTPRKLLQYIGTDVLRNHFHNDIWIASLENKLRNKSDRVVISDVRFKNEIDAIRRMGGIIIRVRRDDPAWLADAHVVNNQLPGHEEALERLDGIHESEYGWVGSDIDYVIDNNGTKQDLADKVNELMIDLLTKPK